jgi:hypothetical protein
MIKYFNSLFRNYFTLNKKNYYFKMLKTGKNFGILNYKSNQDLMVLSTENLEAFQKFKESNKHTTVIGTHSGAFHADEVLSCIMLKFTNMFKDSIISRSRNPEIHKHNNVLVDVGGIYDPNTHRYDHHQKEFKGKL